jgi:hypothetical protein
LIRRNRKQIKIEIGSGKISKNDQQTFWYEKLEENPNLQNGGQPNRCGTILRCFPEIEFLNGNFSTGFWA